MCRPRYPPQLILLPLSVFPRRLLSVMSLAVQEAILSPQFHPSTIAKMSTPDTHQTFSSQKRWNPRTIPARLLFFFFSPSSLRYLRLYTQHRSKDSFLSAHCVRAFFLCHSWTLHLPENMQWRHGNHQNSQTENHIFVPFLISGYMYMKTWV